MKPNHDWKHQHEASERSVKYLQVLHGHNVHAALGPSLHALRAERVHDDERLQDRCLAFLAYLEECVCFFLIITKDDGDPHWSEQTRATDY